MKDFLDLLFVALLAGILIVGELTWKYVLPVIGLLYLCGCLK